MTGRGNNLARILPEGREDLVAAGIILLYCIAWILLRLLVSSTMEIDEAEQFIMARTIALGYSNQPPLFTWIFRAAALPLGMNIVTILAVKYALLFCFYLSYYHIARTFWTPGKSLAVTGALLLFPTYSYEFNRNLTHTILLAAMSSATFLVFVRLLQKKTTTRYLLFGAVVGLGVLSKYNFGFLLVALLLASLSTREGRELLFDRRILLSAAAGILIVLPHALWLVRQNFPSVHEAFFRAHAGQVAAGAELHLLGVALSSFVEAFGFLIAFLAFFRRASQGRSARLLRLIPLYGLLPPLALVFIFHMAHFSGKWLTPVFFTIPLALFSSFDTPERSLRNFGRLCILAIGVTFILRASIGFFPDLTGKFERTHMPVKAVSEQLKQELAAKGISNLKRLVIVTENGYLAANVEANIQDAEFLLVDGPDCKPVPRKNVVAIWDAKEEGPGLPVALRAFLPGTVSVGKIAVHYLHSRKSPPFVLGVAFAAPH